MTRALNKRDALLAASRFDDVRVVNLRGGDGGEITSDKRDALLAAVVAGKHVELQLELLAYEQEAGKRNKKSVRIRDGALQAFGRSAKGRPFLKNHDQGDVASRGGTILDSATERLADGHYVVRQTVSLTAPWACEMALRGLLDALSVNITPTGTVTCSVHGGEVFEECWCFRGDTVEDKNGDKQIVEWLYDSAESNETSAVNVGAVTTAHIESIRAALMLSAGEDSSGTEPRKAHVNFLQKLCQTLGLAATTDEAGILPVVEKMNADLAASRAELVGTKTALASHVALLASANAENALMRTELSVVRDAKLRLDEDAFVEAGKKRGAIALGFDEEEMREDFRRDANHARTRLSRRPDGSRTPVGLGRDSAPSALPGDSAPGARKLTDVELDAAIDAALQSKGIDPARVKKNLINAGMTAEGIRKELLAMSDWKGN